MNKWWWMNDMNSIKWWSINEWNKWIMNDDDDE